MLLVKALHNKKELAVIAEGQGVATPEVLVLENAHCFMDAVLQVGLVRSHTRHLASR